MISIERQQAIELLCRHRLAELVEDERTALLLDWWSIDEDDAEYAHLPESLREKMRETELPDDVNSPENDPLLRIALIHTYRGVRNDYIENQLRIMGLGDFQVEGLPDLLLACPCCGYLTLDAVGQHNLCPVCFWEDNGVTDLDQYSGPNHMSLRTARANFIKSGAVSPEHKKHVAPDGKDRWPRASSGWQFDDA